MIEAWRLIQGPPFDSAALGPLGEAAHHMAVDEAVATAFREGAAPPTLRIYRWTSPAMTIGRFQSPDEIDWEACRRLGIPVARRLTGGSAVYHGSDLTYGVVSGGESLIFRGKTVKESYLMISRALLRGMKRAGVEALPVQAGTVRETSPRCFASPSWHEISVNGRKVIGSAQKRWRNAFLQQGSIPLELDPVAVCRVFRFADEEERRAAAGRLVAKAAGLNDCAGKPVRFEDLERALIAGFEEVFDVRLVRGNLSPRERADAVRLAREKYLLPRWNSSPRQGVGTI
jgi:lipoate-protein ligase A